MEDMFTVGGSGRGGGGGRERQRRRGGGIRETVVEMMTKVYIQWSKNEEVEGLKRQNKKAINGKRKGVDGLKTTQKRWMNSQ